MSGKRANTPVKEGDASFQSRANHVGAAFEVLAEQALRGAGFEILEKHCYIEQLGLEVDFRAKNKKGMLFLVECKGSMHGTRPGLERTDTVKKALCNAFLLKEGRITTFSSVNLSCAARELRFVSYASRRGARNSTRRHCFNGRSANAEVEQVCMHDADFPGSICQRKPTPVIPQAFGV